MIRNPVTYSIRSSQKVRSFDGLNSKSSNFWDSSDDEDLTAVKAEIKEHYLNEQDYTCVYCKQRFVVNHKAVWDTDHIIPKSQYPEFMFVPENLCVSCKDCNTIKGSKEVLSRPVNTFPNKSSDYLISHPHFDPYDRDIWVVEPGVLYVGRTDKGHFTIGICKLFRFPNRFLDLGNVPEEAKSELIEFTSKLANSGNDLKSFVIADGIEKRAANLKKLALGRINETQSLDNPPEDDNSQFQ